MRGAPGGGGGGGDREPAGGHPRAHSVEYTEAGGAAGGAGDRAQPCPCEREGGPDAGDSDTAAEVGTAQARDGYAGDPWRHLQAPRSTDVVRVRAHEGRGHGGADLGGHRACAGGGRVAGGADPRSGAQPAAARGDAVAFEGPEADGAAAVAARHGPVARGVVVPSGAGDARDGGGRFEDDGEQGGGGAETDQRPPPVRLID